jgi:signal transduction histidine kinase
MGQRLRVLYVEDGEFDADLTKTLFDLQAPDITLDIVDTGAACLDRLEDHRYDVLLLDHELPDMSGLTLLTRVTQRQIEMPVVLVTAVGDEALVVRALRLGIWDYVPKQGEYMATLPAVIRRTAHDFARRRINGHPALRLPRRIVYAEHHDADIDLTVNHLAAEAPHLHIEVVRSSRDALARLTSGGIDLLLVDLRMPDLSAIELLREARAAQLTPPVVVVTGQGDEAAAVAAVRLGAYDYIIKRHDYLTQLPYVIENAIHRAQLLAANARLHAELAERKRIEDARHHLEEQLRQSQKIESIGRLAGGVAHDFNNLLTVINGYADLIWLDLSPAHPLRASLLEIRTAGERAADLTRQLLAFSRQQLLQPRVLALNTLIADTTKMLNRLLGEDIELVTRLDPALARIKVDAGQIDQVIINLAVNARDAMPRGGTLTLQTQNVTLDESQAEGHVVIPPGAYVLLAVSDTGVGMAAETLPRIFEPFFTTKEHGKGTGLGLSTVYGIVKQSGGWIWVYSEVDRGTTFKIYFPAVDDPLSDTENRPVEQHTPRGSETVLIVEDDVMVRKLMAQALHGFGYDVLEANGPDDALRLSAAFDRSIPLLITDVVMPRMSGRELAAVLRDSRPDMRILYISGYTDDAVVRHGLLDPAMAFLQKPFTPNALARKVREVLDEPERPISPAGQARAG